MAALGTGGRIRVFGRKLQMWLYWMEQLLFIPIWICWCAIGLNTTLAVCGGLNTGKSTACRYLINLALNEWVSTFSCCNYSATISCNLLLVKLLCIMHVGQISLHHVDLVLQVSITWAETSRTMHYWMGTIVLRRRWWLMQFHSWS